MVWRQASDRRADMEGLQCGVDRHATQALLMSERYSQYERSLLGAILSGAVWTQDRAYRAGLESTD
eukprot:11935825-Karenia_brevis.AAC.1